MNCKKERITPALAQKYLDTRADGFQRKYRIEYAHSLASAMRNGFWTVNHQGILFDVNGHLIDGQHRMGAIVESGTTQTFWVFRDAPERDEAGNFVMDTVDRGACRTVGDQLHIRHGYTNANAVAAAVRFIAMMLVAQGGKTGRMDVGRTLRILEIYKKDVAAVLDILALTSGLRVWRKGAIYAPLSVAHHVAPTEIGLFLQELSSGENLKTGTPAHSLLRWRCGEGMKAGNAALLNTTALAAAKYYQKAPMKTVNKLTRVGVEFWLQMQPRNVERVRQLFA